MATETVDRRTGHYRSVTVTTLACLAGIAAAAISEFVVGAGPKDNVALYVLLGAILVQIPFYRVTGFMDEDTSIKDYLFVAFMTFSLWFVTWTLLLTASA